MGGVIGRLVSKYAFDLKNWDVRVAPTTAGKIKTTPKRPKNRSFCFLRMFNQELFVSDT